MKLQVLIIFIISSIIGFMVKLPKIFYHIDKELHAFFYFSAFIAITLLYPKRWHLIFILLATFGVAIELAQEYSNKLSILLISKRIHGNFDVEDIAYNIIGLSAGIITYGVLSLLLKNRNSAS